MPPREAIALVPFSPGDARTVRGGFTTGLRSLHSFPGFAPVIDMVVNELLTPMGLRTLARNERKRKQAAREDARQRCAQADREHRAPA